MDSDADRIPAEPIPPCPRCGSTESPHGCPGPRTKPVDREMLAASRERIPADVLARGEEYLTATGPMASWNLDSWLRSYAADLIAAAKREARREAQTVAEK